MKVEGPKELVFTSEQRRVINSRRKISQVIAAAGSAKTTTLIAKVRKLIDRGAEPSSILFLTFSRSARDVLKLRAELPSGVRCQTVHSFGLSLLLKGGLIAGLTGNTQPLTSKGQRKYLRKALKQVARRLDNSHPESAAFLRDVRGEPETVKRLLNFIEKVRALGRARKSAIKELAKAVGFAKHIRAIKKVGRRFAEVKAEARALDYADMIKLGTQAIKQGVPTSVSHVLVDEFQDCTPAQAQLVVALAARVESLTVVGDPLQTIFGFAGARFVDLSTLMEGVLKYPLTLSFRLHQGTSAFVAALGRLALPDLLPIRGAGTCSDLPLLIKCKTRHCQDRAVLQVVRHLLDARIAPEKIAILGRTKAQVREAEQLLLSEGVDTDPQYRRREPEHVKAVLKLVALVERCRGKLDKARIEERVRGLAGDRAMPDSTLNGCVRKLIKVTQSKSFVSRYTACKKAYLTIKGRKGLSKDAIADINRWTVVTHRVKNVAEMRELVASISAGRGKVATSHIHQAKGGEWDHVLVLHAVEGSLPFFRARTAESRVEELHVMYVAATRARIGLYFFDGPYKNARARLPFSKRSPFLTAPSAHKHLHELSLRGLSKELERRQRVGSTQVQSHEPGFNGKQLERHHVGDV